MGGARVLAIVRGQGSEWRATALRLAPFALLIAGAAIVFAFGLHRHLRLTELAEHRAELKALVDAHGWRALAAFALVYAALVALSIPGALVLTVMAGFLFGWVAGGTVALLAATLGATLVFLAARTAIGDALASRAGPRLERLIAGFRADAISYLLFLRLVPAFPFWLVNLAPALAGIPLGTYVATTLVGILPGTYAFALLGAGLDSVVEAHRVAYEACLAAGREGCRMRITVKSLVTPGLIAGMLGLGLVSLIPVLLRRWAGRRLSGLDGGRGLP